MSKIAFVFAGQGAQYVGMGKSLYETSDVSKHMFETANELLNFDLLTTCFEGPEDLLKRTDYTQPAIFTTSAVCLQRLKDAKITPDVVAGFSLGEYNALQAANVFSFEDGVKLVAKRGALMNAASKNGKMAAILGLDLKTIQAVCEQASVKGVVEPANLNCPGQIVIAGEGEAVDYACELAKQNKARRALPLAVGGPFHTSLLKEAAEEFSQTLEAVNLNQPNIPIVLNVLGQYYDATQPLLPLMVSQMHSSVKWEQSVREMIADGVTTFVEIGPGKTLSSFIKKIDRSVTVLNVEDEQTLQATIEALS